MWYGNNFGKMSLRQHRSRWGVPRADSMATGRKPVSRSAPRARAGKTVATKFPGNCADGQPRIPPDQAERGLDIPLHSIPYLRSFWRSVAR